jgi:hypothetical protein
MVVVLGYMTCGVAGAIRNDVLVDNAKLTTSVRVGPRFTVMLFEFLCLVLGVVKSCGGVVMGMFLRDVVAELMICPEVTYQSVCFPQFHRRRGVRH